MTSLKTVIQNSLIRKNSFCKLAIINICEENYRNVLHRPLKLETAILSLYETLYVTQKYMYIIYSIKTLDNHLAMTKNIA